MYFEAYKKANLATESPAQTEYRLFAEITRELEITNGEETLTPTRIKVLFRNNQLWLTLRTDLMSEENNLDIETKAGLISLAIWVDKFTGSAMRNTENLDPLISVNKQIMQGLIGSARAERSETTHTRSEIPEVRHAVI